MKVCIYCGIGGELMPDRNAHRECYNAQARASYRKKHGKTIVSKQTMIDVHGKQAGELRWAAFKKQEDRIRREMGI